MSKRQPKCPTVFYALLDKQFEWMSLTERKIMTDSILPEEEKALLKAIRNFKEIPFFFTKFYELVEIYRHFLLIRIRYADHQLTDDFVKKNQSLYQTSKKTNEKLHAATVDIIAQYAGKQKETLQWESWLTNVFYEEKMDGLNRHLALVRLAFIAFNYRNFDLLTEKFDFMDDYFSKGKYYSKRILLNYYNNRLILHSRSREYEKAAYYGYLSVRDKNHDYIPYVNNLCAVLLRLERNQEALDLMKNAAPEAKTTKNFHSRTGFVSFYLEALNKNGLYKNAENYGDSFLRAFSKEILRYRWHLFFSTFFEALLRCEHYEKLLQISRKYKLLERDKNYEVNAGYIPTIPLFFAVARYKEGILNKKDLLKILNGYIEQYKTDDARFFSFKKVLQDLEHLIPRVLDLKGSLKE